MMEEDGTHAETKAWCRQIPALLHFCVSVKTLQGRRLVPFALVTGHYGAAIDVPQEALLCYQVQSGAGGKDSWYVWLRSFLTVLRNSLRCKL